MSVCQLLQNQLVFISSTIAMLKKDLRYSTGTAKGRVQRTECLPILLETQKLQHHRSDMPVVLFITRLALDYPLSS